MNITAEKLEELAGILDKDWKLSFPGLHDWVEDNSSNFPCFTPEKIEDLSTEIADARQRDNSISFDTIKLVITNYCKQNQINPVVLGITNDQVFDLVEWMDEVDEFKFTKYEWMEEWLKTQTFTLPEVKEVAVGLTDAQKESLSDFINTHKAGKCPMSVIVEQWFDNNSASFRLTDKLQGQDLSHLLNIELLESYNSVVEELEQLRVQLTPNWDDAPRWANWLAQDENGAWYWHETKPQPYLDGEFRQNVKVESRRFQLASKNYLWKNTLQQRPQPPAPKVEVGQVWRYVNTKKEYRIVLIGDMKEDGEWVECVTYSTLDAFYTRTLTYFLAKFERVL